MGEVSKQGKVRCIMSFTHLPSQREFVSGIYLVSDYERNSLWRSWSEALNKGESYFFKDKNGDTIFIPATVMKDCVGFFGARESEDDEETDPLSILSGG